MECSKFEISDLQMATDLKSDRRVLLDFEIEQILVLVWKPRDAIYYDSYGYKIKSALFEGSFRH